MATLTIKKEVIETVTTSLHLNQEETYFLRCLLGHHVGGNGYMRKIADELYRTLSSSLPNSMSLGRGVVDLSAEKDNLFKQNLRP